ncbi:hypothetical protein [Caldiplasma sukawensis]
MEEFKNSLENEFKKSNEDNYNVYLHKNLRYKLSFEPDEDKRGDNSFQIDVLILDRNEIPLLAIEIKTYDEDTPTTHDILVYSTKAHRHKVVYPWLRYGLIWSNRKPVTGKLFKNNEFLDFFGGISKEDITSKDERWERFVDLILRQLRFANRLRDLFTEKDEEKLSFYSSECLFINENV